MKFAVYVEVDDAKFERLIKNHRDLGYPLTISCANAHVWGGSASVKLVEGEPEPPEQTP